MVGLGRPIKPNGKILVPKRDRVSHDHCIVLGREKSTSLTRVPLTFFPRPRMLTHMSGLLQTPWQVQMAQELRAIGARQLYTDLGEETWDIPADRLDDARRIIAKYKVR